MPLTAFTGTLLAVFADPVWRLALTGAPALLELALMAASVDLYLTRFFVCTDVDPQLLEENEAKLRRVSLKANAGAYAAFLIAGALVIETPVALVLPVAFGLVALISGLVAYGQVSPFASTRFWCFLDGVRTVSSPLMLALGAGGRLRGGGARAGNRRGAAVRVRGAEAQPEERGGQLRRRNELSAGEQAGRGVAVSGGGKARARRAGGEGNPEARPQ